MLDLVWALLTLIPAVAGNTSTTICHTKYGSRSVHHVPTTTHATTFTSDALSTTTVTSTRTTTPTTTTVVTSTSTATVTRPEGITTVVVTSTDTDTTSTSVISTTTAVSTVTSTPSVTIAASSGFTPVASESTVIAAGGGQAISHPNGQVVRETVSPKADGRYPTEVECFVVHDDVHTSVTTISRTVSTVKTAPVKTITSKVTKTTTTTVRDSATASSTKISTVTSTITHTETKRTTTSITKTSVAPTQTYYEVCANDNYIQLVGGNYIVNYSAGPGVSTTVITLSGNNQGAGGCCEACATLDTCTGYSLFGAFSCTLYVAKDGTAECNPAASFWSFSVNSGAPPDIQLGVGNGNCGQGLYVF